MKLISKIASLSVGLALAVGVGVALGSKEAKAVWADDDPSVTIVAATKDDFDTSPWSITNKPTGIELNDNARGWQWGSGTSTVITYTSNATYSKVVVTASTNGTSSSISVSVGGDSFGSNNITSGTAAKNTPYEFEGSGTGNVVITVSNTASKSTWIKQIDLYEGGTVDPLESITVSGSMSKTSYTTAESWDASGLVATGHYESGASKDISSSVNWTFSPASPTVGVTSVIATATKGTISGNSEAQSVTVSQAAHSGTESDPFTVAEARAQIDKGTGLSGKYATGIVSRIVTPYSTQYSNVTFNFSDDGTTTSPQLQAYREKSSYSSTVKVGDIVVVGGTLKKYNSTYEFDANCAISSLTEPTGTKYSVTGNIDHGQLNVSEILEKTALSVNVVPEVGYYYPETLSSVKVGGVDVAYSYVNGVVSIAADKVTGNITISGTCVACNPLKSLYARPAGYSAGIVYGYYVGFLEGTGPVIMDGAYGIVIYNSSADVSEFTEMETILSVSGTIADHHGLCEISNANFKEAEGEYDAPATPAVYAAAGGETREYANRLTTVTGVPAIASGSKGDFSSAAGTNDITMNFTVGSNNIQVFYKKAAQTADAEAFAAVKAAVEGSTEVTVKGFTGWYDGFQVQMNGYVKPAESYTAEDFAQDLLDQTDNVCSEYPGSDKDPSYDYSSYQSALVAIWSDLASNDKYPSLPSEEKTILAEASREGDTVISRAMFRYDFLTGKYNLSNFINGRDPIVPAGAYANLTLENNPTIFIVITIATASTLAFTLLLVFKKRKHN